MNNCLALFSNFLIGVCVPNIAPIAISLCLHQLHETFRTDQVINIFVTGIDFLNLIQKKKGAKSVEPCQIYAAYEW